MRRGLCTLYDQSPSACRRCSNYIFILDFTPDFNGLGKDNAKTRRETYKFLEFDASYIRGSPITI